MERAVAAATEVVVAARAVRVVAAASSGRCGMQRRGTVTTSAPPGNCLGRPHSRKARVRKCREYCSDSGGSRMCSRSCIQSLRWCTRTPVESAMSVAMAEVPDLAENWAASPRRCGHHGTRSTWSGSRSGVCRSRHTSLRCRNRPRSLFRRYRRLRCRCRGMCTRGSWCHGSSWSLKRARSRPGRRRSRTGPCATSTSSNRNAPTRPPRQPRIPSPRTSTCIPRKRAGRVAEGEGASGSSSSQVSQSSRTSGAADVGERVATPSTGRHQGRSIHRHTG